MRCPACGHQNPEHARLCRDCGLSLYVECSACGVENAADRTFCTNCQAQLRETSPAGLGATGAPAAFELGRPAGFWIRFLASIIDGIPLFLVSALLAWVIFGESIFDWAESGGVTAGDGLNFVLGGLYATAFVSLLGGTVGVLLLKMRILRPDGTMLGPGRALARYLVLVVSSAFILPLIVSAFMVGIRQDRRSIHDLVCDTVMVIQS